MTKKGWFVIINPASGNGSSKRKWPKIKSLLGLNRFEFEFAFTKHSKHSIEIVQGAVNHGFTNIIAVGGDGTIHNIINGIMIQKTVTTHSIHLGVIPIGTGNDWIKTHNIPNNIEKAIQVLKFGKISHQDIGKAVVKNSKTKTLYFNNLLGVGFDGCVVSKANKIKKLGALAYIIATLQSLFLFKNFKSKTRFNSVEIEEKTLMILIGLCKYSGGGMRLTEAPNPVDGLFDISIGGDFGKLKILLNTIKMFNGKVVNIKDYKTYKTDSISIKILEEKKPFIQADGELIGTGNLQVSIVPKALSFYCN